MDGRRPAARGEGSASDEPQFAEAQDAPERTISAVLWDFGGVVTTSPFEAFARYERERGLPEGFIRRVNATNPDANAWALLERNEVDLDGFCERFAAESAALGHELDGREVLALLAGDLRPDVVRAIHRCREHGFRTAVLTNNIVSMDGTAAGFSFEELFDVVVESSKAGVRKPDPAAYELVLDLLDVPAEEVVFLDDLGINLKPAQAMGMATIKVVEPAAALAELESLLGVSLR